VPDGRSPWRSLRVGCTMCTTHLSLSQGPRASDPKRSPSVGCTISTLRIRCRKAGAMPSHSALREDSPAQVSAQWHPAWKYTSVKHAWAGASARS